GGEFADLLGEPHEGPLVAAGGVLLVVHAADERLEVAEGHRIQPGGSVSVELYRGCRPAAKRGRAEGTNQG
ncbi:MAG: hypothetical protein ACK55I_36950, partial [bacterium]